MKLAQLRSRTASFLIPPVVGLLLRLRVSPNLLTILGLMGNLAAAAVIAQGYFFWGGVLVLLSGLFDLWDGALARATGRASPLGALLDSLLDRVSEAALLFGLLVFYWPRGLGVISLLFAALAGSFLVSYIRARGEGLGLSCPVGFFTRPERVVVLGLGLMLNQAIPALGVIAVLSWLTAAQRFSYLKAKARPSTPKEIVY